LTFSPTFTIGVCPMINQQLIKLAKGMGNSLILVILIGSLSGLLIIAQCFLIAELVDGAFLKEQGLTELATGLSALLSLILLRAFLFWAGEIFSLKGSLQVQTKLRQTVLGQVFRSGPLSSRQQDTGQMISSLIDSVDALEDFFARYLPTLALAGIIPLGILIIVFPRDLLTALILLLTAPLIPLFMMLIGSLADKWAKKQWHVLGKMNSHFLDVLEGLTTLKLLQKSLKQTKTIEQLGREWAETTMGVLKIAFLSAFFLEFFMTISTALIAVSLGLRLLTGNMDFQTAFFLLLLAPEFYGPLRNLGTQYHAGISATKAVENVFRLLSSSPREVQFGERPVNKEILNKQIKFENVSFYYEDQRQALRKITLSIQPQEKLALVGASGAGKSTLLQLLLGFAHPQAGQILIGELPLSAFKPESLRQQIALVPQKPHLFRGTIAENIAFFKPAATLPEIKTAALKVGLHQIVLELPAGYETIIGGGGRSLSSGQGQLIALARAFLLDAPLVLLDEATTSLDPVSEEAIQKALAELLKDRRAIIAAHRLATLKQVDRIAVLNRGSLVEIGSQAELLANEGFYYRLLNSYLGKTSD